MENFKVEGGLLPSGFEHKLYINAFLKDIQSWRNHRVNKEIYSFLLQVRRDPGAKGDFWVGLNFFNFLYEQLDIIETHPNQPLKIIEHLRSLVINDLQLYAFLNSLNRLRFVLAPITLDMLDDSRYEIKLKRYSPQEEASLPKYSWRWTCIDIIQGEFGYLHEFSKGWPTKFVFDFEDIEKFSEAGKDPDETIRSLMEWIKCYKQQVDSHPRMFYDDGGRFIHQCELKIERIRKLQAESYHTSKPERPVVNNTAAVSSLGEDTTKAYSNLLPYGYTMEQVLQYFMQLSRYYSEEQVMGFLKANFEGFAEPGEQVKKVKLPTHRSLDKQHIMHMVQCFWQFQKQSQFNKKAAAALLEDNFACFESFDITSNKPIEKRTVYSNMGKKPKKGYPFSDTMLR